MKNNKTITTARSSLGLRECLFEELDKLRNGEATPARVNVAAKTAAQIIGTVRLELEMARLSASLGGTLPETYLVPVEMS